MVHYYYRLLRENLNLYLQDTCTSKIGPGACYYFCRHSSSMNLTFNNSQTSLLCLRVQECAKDGNGSS